MSKEKREFDITKRKHVPVKFYPFREALKRAGVIK